MIFNFFEPEYYTLERKWQIVRQERARLLSASDWTQLPDAVLTTDERTAWQNYRQALRDIPQDFATPEDVTFPTQPEAQ